MLGGPERQVFGWVMCQAKKLDFNQVNRMEKKDVCTAEYIQCLSVSHSGSHVTHICLAAEQQVIEAMTLQTVFDYMCVAVAGGRSASLMSELESQLALQQKGITAQTSRKLHDAASGSMTLLHLPSYQVAHKRGPLPASQLQAAWL